MNADAVPAPERLAILALSHVEGVGPNTARNLIAYAGGPSEVFNLSVARLLRIQGVGPKTARRILEEDHLDWARDMYARCQKLGLRILTFLDDDYPEALRHIHNAPPVLYLKGSLEMTAQPAIAIVGTRKATEYGRTQARIFARAFAEAGVNVVSGLAYGIDAAAHAAALEAGGLTTAVLAHGLDRTYPAPHAPLAREIVEKGGLLVSEYPLGVAPDAQRFPHRNRIIAGVCRAVVVIEAAASGGALITARQAFDQDRDVFALPGRIGDPASEGCNQLIREHVARLTVDPAQALEDLGLAPGNAPAVRQEALPLPAEPLPEVEAKAFAALNRKPEHLDVIAQRAGLPTEALLSALLMLEFKGLARQAPGRLFGLP